MCLYIFKPIICANTSWLHGDLESVESSEWAGSSSGCLSFVAMISHDPTQGRAIPLYKPEVSHSTSQMQKVGNPSSHPKS